MPSRSAAVNSSHSGCLLQLWRWTSRQQKSSRKLRDFWNDLAGGKRVGWPDGKRISQMLAIRPHIPARRGAHTECTHLGHLQALRIQQTCKLRYGPVCPSSDCPACGVRPRVRRVPQRLRSIVLIPPQFCWCSADFCQCPPILCQAPAGFHPRFHPLPPFSTPFHPVRCQSSAIILHFSRHAAPYCRHRSCAIPPHSPPSATCLPFVCLCSSL